MKGICSKYGVEEKRTYAPLPPKSPEKWDYRHHRSYAMLSPEVGPPTRRLASTLTGPRRACSAGAQD